MLRREISKAPPADKPAPPEIQLTDVTRLIVMFDTHLSLEFDLGEGDRFIDADDSAFLLIEMKQRRLKIAKARILYSETRPEQLKTFIAPK